MFQTHSYQFAIIILYVALSIWAVVTDLKEKRISNKNILMLAILGIAVCLLRHHQDHVSLVALLTRFGLALAIGLGLYLMGFWAPGDGKLFTVLCLAIPVGDAYPRGLPLPAKLISWTLGMAATYIMIVRAPVVFRHIASWRRNPERNVPRRLSEFLNWPRVSGWLRGLFQIIAFMGLNFILGLVLPFHLGLLQSLAIAALFSVIAGKVSAKWQLIALSPFALYGGVVLVRYGWFHLLLISACMGAIHLGKLVILVFEKALSREVDFLDIKPGDYLKDYIGTCLDNGVRVITAKNIQAARMEGFVSSLGPEEGALGPREVEKIRSLAESCAFFATRRVNITWAIPFAPFLAAGAWAMVVSSFLSP